jgi:hypothetical protein
MTTSIVECPHCHFRFNYEFIPGGSFHSIRLGTQRLFKCPNCREIHRFNITQFGTDSSLPTYGDNKETGIGIRIWALLLGPLLVFIIIGFVLRFIFGFHPLLFMILPVAIGIIWTVVYVVHLVKIGNRDVTNKGEMVR